MTENQSIPYDYICERIEHFRLRALERYGLDVSDDDIIEIIILIQNGESEYVLSKSNVRKRHKIEYKGVEMLIDYDKKHGIPLTAIPYESYEESRGKITEEQYRRETLGRFYGQEI